MDSWAGKLSRLLFCNEFVLKLIKALGFGRGTRPE